MKKRKRIGPLKALTAALLACCLLMTGFAEDGALSTLNSQYQQLEQQRNDLQTKVNEAKTAKAKQQAIKNQLTSEVNILSGQIEILEQKIAYYEDEIARNEESIDSLNAKIDDNYQLLKKRLRAMYMAGDASTLELIFGGETYSDSVSTAVYLKSIAKHDQQLIDDLVADRREVEDKQAEVDAAKADIEASKTEVESKKTQMSAKVANANSVLQDIAASEKEYLANLTAVQADMKAVQAEIDQIYAQMADSGEYVGGTFMYPVPGHTYISSYFGWRFNGTDFHTGVDFPAPGGTSIRATNAGTVTFVKTTFVAGKGYGKYLIIDHGGGYSSLYGHCSAITVKVGDVVAKGQEIAKVGTTGWSTGNHCHFEIRVNGAAKNPLNYLGK